MFFSAPPLLTPWSLKTAKKIFSTIDANERSGAGMAPDTFCRSGPYTRNLAFCRLGAGIQLA